MIGPSFTSAVTTNAIPLTGESQVFVDIDLRTFNIDPATFEAAITPHARTIQPVHLDSPPLAASKLLRSLREKIASSQSLGDS